MGDVRWEEGEGLEGVEWEGLGDVGCEGEGWGVEWERGEGLVMYCEGVHYKKE